MQVKKLRGQLIVLLSVSFLVSCAHEGSSYSYGYYTGKKNPHVTRDTPHDESSNANISSSPQTTRANDEDKAGKVQGDYHVVSKGETLYSLAWQYGYDVREVASWNGIQAPYIIYPRQKLRVKPPKRPYSAPREINQKKQHRYSANKKSSSTKTNRKTLRRNKTWQKISWQWPTKGKIIGTFSARDSGKKGLDIAGKNGQPVYAAASGEVVYSGSGLRGYGKLVIIKHNETIFSAYAHNRHLFVKEAQQIKKGQHIADMGSSEADRAMLHFEVRRNGKPVDPMKYLPARR